MAIASKTVLREDAIGKCYLKKLSTEEKKDWEKYLPASAFAYQFIKQATTGHFPFYLLYGYEPDTLFDQTIKPINVKDSSFEIQLRIRTAVQIKQLNNIRKEALKKIEKPQKLQIKRLEKKMNQPKEEWKPSFNIGDIVKLYCDNIKTSWSTKISIRWHEENFCILEKHRKGSYLIKNISNPNDPRLHLVHGNSWEPFIRPAISWDKEFNLIGH